MSFRIECGEGINEAVRRIADEQISKGIAEIDDSSLDCHEKVHQFRKRCKKMRGLLRLVRPSLGETYSSENKAFRDAARVLSEIRDAKTVIATYDELMDHFDDQIKRSAFSPIRRRLTNQLNEISDDCIHQKLMIVRERFAAAKRRASDWVISENGFAALAGGLTKTRKRAVKRFADVLEDPNTEILHQLRKRVKYHRYHLRLLRNVWPVQVTPLITSLDQLGGQLGDDHDLAVFRQTIDEDADDVGNSSDRRVIHALIDRHRAETQSDAVRLAQFIFAEPTEAFVDRLEKYWTVWREQ